MTTTPAAPTVPRRPGGYVRIESGDHYTRLLLPAVEPAALGTFRVPGMMAATVGTDTSRDLFKRAAAYAALAVAVAEEERREAAAEYARQTKALSDEVSQRLAAAQYGAFRQRFVAGADGVGLTGPLHSGQFPASPASKHHSDAALDEPNTAPRGDDGSRFEASGFYVLDHEREVAFEFDRRSTAVKFANRWNCEPARAPRFGWHRDTYLILTRNR